jgi:hypothetical protein
MKAKVRGLVGDVDLNGIWKRILKIPDRMMVIGALWLRTVSCGWLL